MGPEGYLPFFDSPHDTPRESTSNDEYEKKETENPYIEPLGELGKEAYDDSVRYMGEIRAKHPLWSDERIIKDACITFELRGNEWKMALEWAIKNGEVPPRKKLPETIKLKPASPKHKSPLSRLGGNRHADDIAHNND